MTLLLVLRCLYNMPSGRDNPSPLSQLASVHLSPERDGAGSESVLVLRAAAACASPARSNVITIIAGPRGAEAGTSGDGYGK
jgi:hypothetical protein